MTPASSALASTARPTDVPNPSATDSSATDSSAIDPDAILERQAARESSARAYARSFPIVPVHATGMTITGADGGTYLDCLSGAGALALGHNHPAVVEAVRAVMDSGAPVSTLDLATPVKDAFVQTLFDLLPPGLAENGRVHFCGPSGSDAVEAALKLTQTATGRHGLFAFTGGYHGMTAGALGATGNLAVRERVAPSPAEVTRLPYPHGYRCPFGVGGEDGARLSERYARSLLADVSSGVLPPAGMILEPVQGEGGVVPAPASWLRSMRELTSAYDIPLIVDEVQAGVGRTGAFWGVDHADITPDVMVLSKAIGGGLPIAVIVYSDDLDRWNPGAHTGTFRGHQLAMAAGTATLRVVAEEGLADRARTLGAHLQHQLSTLAGEHSSIGDVRGRGLMLGIEVVDPHAEPAEDGALPAAPARARRIRAEALRRGLIVELGGRDDTVVRLLPPLTMSDAEADAVLERLADAWAAADRAGEATEPFEADTKAADLPAVPA